MPVEGDILFKTREQVLNEIQANFLLLVPDAYLGDDGNLNLLFKVMSGVIESVFLANQVVSEDMFVATANEGALERWGQQYGVPRKAGTRSTGELKFFGQGGTFIPIGTEVAYDPGTGDQIVYFRTTEEGVIPNPGTPTPPTVQDLDVGNVTGAIEYAVSFVTAVGETLISDPSEPITVTSRTLRLTGVPLGGPGTLKRRIYRQRDGDGIWKLVVEINDNSTTQYDDNMLDAGLGANPIAFSTAENVTVDAESESPGFASNVGAGAISVLTNVPDGITAVVNPGIFTGASDEETSFEYRQRLLATIRAPFTGSPADLKVWAEEINGVESASVFTNNNMGAFANGHATVRIASDNSTQPEPELISQVLEALQSRDMANITLHVAGFDAVATNVTVDVTLEDGFTLADVLTMVQFAIADYINSLEVGETLMVAGIVSAVFNLPGILDVTVTSPATNQATDEVAKRTVGTITVT